MAEYIDAGEMIKNLTGMKEKLGYNAVAIEGMIKGIQDAIVPDVAPVLHGRWEWQTGDLYMCTVCKADCHVEECLNEPKYDYCPNCGAKMDGEVVG